MSLFEERDPRFVNLERKVGIFVVLGIAATVSAVVLLGVRQGVFTPRAALYFRVASAEDLAEGAEVLTRGFRIGKVARLRLDDAGRVEVRLAVDKDSIRWIKRDSRVRLSKSLLVGGAKVVITPGTPGAVPVGEGDELPFESGVGLSESAQQAIEEFKPVLLQLAATIEALGDPNGDFMTTLANLNRLTANLDETQRGIGGAFDTVGSKFGRLLDDLDEVAVSLRDEVLPEVKAVVEKADQTAAGAERTARAAEALVGTELRQLVENLHREVLPEVREAVRSAGGATAALEKKLPPILDQIQASLDTIRAITLDLKQASVEAPALLQEGGALVRDSEALVKRVGEMWLLRSDEPPPTERTIDVDSYQRRD